MRTSTHKQVTLNQIDHPLLKPKIPDFIFILSGVPLPSLLKIEQGEAVTASSDAAVKQILTSNEVCNLIIRLLMLLTISFLFKNHSLEEISTTNSL